MTAPIELAPTRGATTRRLLTSVRRGAGRLHVALALTIVLAVFVQVYLIGSYIFGAGQGALDAHRTVGFTTHGLEALTFVAALVAWLPRRDVVLSALLAVIGTVQVGLASEHRWVGGLHPLFALVVLALATALARRGRSDGRLRRHLAAASCSCATEQSDGAAASGAFRIPPPP